MNIFQKITGRTGGALSPEMQLALRDKTKANKMLVDLQLRTEMLTKKASRSKKLKDFLN